MLDLTKNLLLCDTSYAVFFKFYSLVTWYKMSQRGDVESLLQEALPEDFLLKYHKCFLDMVNGWKDRFGVPYENIVFARDCSREHIWRNALFASYKSTRSEKNKSFNSSIFTYTYTNIIDALKKQHGCHEVCMDSLEADDCVAVMIKYLRTVKRYDGKITVITNDNDYIQLHKYNVSLMNLQGKSLYDRINDVENYLHLKQIMGDVSDAIPAIAPKVGPKTALKYVNDSDLLNKQLQKEEVRLRYQLNKKLVDFDEIPPHLVERFQDTLTCILP